MPATRVFPTANQSVSRSWTGAFTLFAVAITVVGSAGAVRAAPRLPIPVQAAIIKKILPFDRTFAKSGKSKVAIVDLGSSEDAAAMAAMFQKLAVPHEVFSGSELSRALDCCAAVYFSGSAIPDRTAQSVASAGVLSITAVPSLVENGFASIALGIKSGNPEIVINLARSKLERQEISASLLGLARVVGRK